MRFNQPDCVFNLPCSNTLICIFSLRLLLNKETMVILSESLSQHVCAKNVEKPQIFPFKQYSLTIVKLIYNFFKNLIWNACNLNGFNSTWYSVWGLQLKISVNTFYFSSWHIGLAGSRDIRVANIAVKCL